MSHCLTVSSGDVRVVTGLAGLVTTPHRVVQDECYYNSRALCQTAARRGPDRWTHVEEGFSCHRDRHSPEMVKACKAHWPQIDVRVMDLQQHRSLTKHSTRSSHTLVYVDDVDTTLREMRRILKPQGKLLFSIPNYWFINGILDGGFLRGKRHLTRICHHSVRPRIGKGSDDTLSTQFMSMRGARRVRKIFPFVRVRGRLALQHLKNRTGKITCLPPSRSSTRTCTSSVRNKLRLGYRALQA